VSTQLQHLQQLFTTKIWLQWQIQVLAAVAAAGTATYNLGSLNGVFYTDATTSKPTFQNYLQGSNTATDIVAFVTDDPHQVYAVQI